MVDGGTIESKMQKAGGNLSAVLGDLDAGHWILGGGPRSDPFWREDEVLVIDDTTAKTAGIATFEEADSDWGNWECGNKLYQDPKHAGAPNCCFYYMTHLCAGATPEALTKRFSTSSGMSMHNIGTAFPKRVILFFGDSLSHQSFEAASCDLRRNGWVQTKTTKIVLDKALSKIVSDNNEMQVAELHGPQGDEVIELRFLMIGGQAPLPLIKLALGYDDEVNVAVMNLGVWYSGTLWPQKPMADESRRYKGTVTSVLKELTKWKARKLGRVAIFRGTFPQHFDNVAGMDPARRGGGGLCVPSVPQLDVSPYDAAVPRAGHPRWL